MKSLAFLTACMVLAASALAARAADDSKVKAGTQQVESGTKKIGDGQIGEGVKETAKGIGNTVSEGAKYTGERIKEGGKAAEPKAKSAWTSVKEGAVEFGQSVKAFFSNAF
jgi:hypothetical protein